MSYDLNWHKVRKMFRGRLTSSQMDGTKRILAACDKYGVTSRDEVAYVLGTAKVETAHKMQPVMETLSTNVNSAIRKLDRAYAKGQLRYVRRPYWRKDGKGRSWLGRGDVQLTGRRNYQARNRRLVKAEFGVDIFRSPDSVMRPDISAFILVVGMRDGWFTGKKLRTYFAGRKHDWRGARKIVNPGDKSRQVDRAAKDFYNALVPVKSQSLMASLEKAKPKPKLVRKNKREETVEVANYGQEDEGFEPVFEQVSKVDTSERTVKNVQARLVQLGYPLGKVDGIKGTLTNQAILSFKSDNDLPITFDIDGSLKESLFTAKQRERRTASMEELRQMGSSTVASSDAVTSVGTIAGTIAATGAASETLGKMTEQIGESATTFEKISVLVRDNAIWIVLAMAIYMLYQAYKIRKIRLEDHNSNKNTGR